MLILVTQLVNFWVVEWLFSIIQSQTCPIKLSTWMCVAASNIFILFIQGNDGGCYFVKTFDMSVKTGFGLTGGNSRLIVKHMLLQLDVSKSAFWIGEILFSIIQSQTRSAKLSTWVHVVAVSELAATLACENCRLFFWDDLFK